MSLSPLGNPPETGGGEGYDHRRHRHHQILHTVPPAAAAAAAARVEERDFLFFPVPFTFPLTCGNVCERASVRACMCDDDDSHRWLLGLAPSRERGREGSVGVGFARTTLLLPPLAIIIIMRRGHRVSSDPHYCSAYIAGCRPIIARGASRLLVQGGGDLDALLLKCIALTQDTFSHIFAVSCGLL